MKLAKNTYILLVVICSHEIRVNQTTSNSARVAINFDILIHSSIHLTLVTLKTPLVCRDRFVVCIPHFDRIQPLHDDDLSTINLSLFLLFIHLIPPHKVHKHKTNDCFFFCSYKSNDSRKLNKQKKFTQQVGEQKYSQDCSGYVRRVSRITKNCSCWGAAEQAVIVAIIFS